MSKENFTSGPWYVKQSEAITSPYWGKTSSTRITILDAQDGQYKPRHVIAQVARGNGRGAANAALISAAPELYKELERHCALCVMQHPEMEKCELCGTRKALKKARGGEVKILEQCGKCKKKLFCHWGEYEYFQVAFEAGCPEFKKEEKDGNNTD